ncbi:MAG: aminotransferase class IV [Nitriliruptoraceae bacterium]
MTPSHTQHPVGTDRATSAPRPIAWMDGRVVPASEATVPLTDEGFLRGDAVFEAVLVRRGQTHALEAHLARMRRSAHTLSLRLPVLKRVVQDLLAGWGDQDGTLRLIVTRTGTIRGMLSQEPHPETMSLAVLDIPWGSALTGTKTLSYALNMWATRQARELGADDALIVQDGTILELPTGAIGIVRDGQVHAPDPAALPILDSVTMQQLADIVDLEWSTPSLADVLTADELFIVSASRPVVPVHAVLAGDEERTLTAPGPMTRALHDRLLAHIDATLDDG